MKFRDMRRGQVVTDRWFPHWGAGRVTRVMRTRVVVLFVARELTYDAAHCQFLSIPLDKHHE